MKPSRAFIFSLVVVVLGLLALSACKVIDAPMEQSDVLQNTQTTAIVQAAGPLGQSVIDGLATDDYATFSGNFDADVKSGWSESDFQSFLHDLQATVGNYQSYRVDSVLQNEEYSTVVYVLTFDSGKTVNMRLILPLSAPYQITGLWFDSPELVQ